jgi:hypothetical protein
MKISRMAKSRRARGAVFALEVEIGSIDGAIAKLRREYCREIVSVKSSPVIDGLGPGRQGRGVSLAVGSIPVRFV